MPDQPTSVEVSYGDYPAWCARDKAGELQILSVVCLPKSGKYLLKLRWPETPTPKQIEFL